MIERILLPIADGRTVLASVRRRARHHRLAIGGGTLLLVGSTVSTLLVPPLVGRIVDRIDAGTTPSALWGPVALMLVAVLAGAVLALGAEVLLAQAGQTMVAHLREEVVDAALALPIGQVEEAGSGDLVARVGNDVTVVGDAVQRVLPWMLFAGLTIGLTVIGLAALDWRFAVAAIVVMPIQAWTVRWYVKRCMPLYAAERVAEGELGHELLGSLRGAATVRAFRLGPAHVERITRRSEAANDLAYAGTKLRTRLYGRLNVAEAIGMSLILLVGYVLVRSGSATIGATTAAALYFHRIFDPVNAVVGLFDDLLLAHAGLARLIGVAESAPAATDVGGQAPTDASVRATAVEYEYQPGVPVLHDVTLSIAPGEHVAVVGTSGAGKSTLAKLVAGVHEPTAGTVALGGADLGGLEPAVVRRAVALVTQEVHVFAGTLADDLRLARPSAADEELGAALDEVGAGWWRDLPDGMATLVGGNGHRLDPVHAQQLALARLVLLDTPIVVLDEATAEAGSIGARTLERSAAAAILGRTAVVVGHRLTQAQSAGRIVVMERGRIVEDGTHDQLSEEDGPYGRLWRAWTGARESRLDGVN